MTDDTKALVKLLRTYAEADGTPTVVTIHRHTLKMAADAIEAAEAEIAELRERDRLERRADGMDDLTQQLREENERFRALAESAVECAYHGTLDDWRRIGLDLAALASRPQRRTNID